MVKLQPVPLQQRQVPIDPIVRQQPAPSQLRQVLVDQIVKLQAVPLQKVPIDPMVRRQAAPPLLSQVLVNLMVNQALLCNKYSRYFGESRLILPVMVTSEELFMNVQFRCAL